eukprot:853236-Rhodomonas_salina.2
MASDSSNIRCKESHDAPLGVADVVEWKKEQREMVERMAQMRAETKRDWIEAIAAEARERVRIKEQVATTNR